MNRTPRRYPTIQEFLQPGRDPRVIAHRGLSGAAPENTLSAFRAAISAGADMLECDVTLTSNGEVVVIHDADLDRTTSGAGKVQDRTLEDLRALDAGRWFSAAFEDERIPTLDEVLDVVDGEILINVEIKAEAVTADERDGIVARVIRRIRERGLGDQVVLSSFLPLALAQAQRLAPDIARAALFDEREHAGMGPLEVMDAVGASSFNLGMDEVDAAVVAACHGQGRLVLVYTVNQREDMERVLELSVDGLFTDHADRLLELLAECAP